MLFAHKHLISFDFASFAPQFPASRECNRELFASQSRSARASALFLLEWLKKIRDMEMPLDCNPSAGKPSGQL
jgi:hypothetical protein